MSIINILGESAVRSLVLAIAVWLVLRLLRVEHARLAKRAWMGVLILALAMPLLVAFHIPSISMTALWRKPQTILVDASATGAPAASAPLSSGAIATPAAPSFLPTVPVPAALQGAPAHVRAFAWWQLGFAAYLAITAFLLARLALGLMLSLRLWRRAQPFAAQQTEHPVRLSLDLRSPVTVGNGILLPLEALAWDELTLRATLAHEAEHIREGDFHLQILAALHHAFFWISPLAWALRPQLSRLSETICDRAGIAATGGDGLTYAQLLLRFASAEQTPAGMVAMAQSASLRERIERLIADPELSGAFRRRRGQAAVAALLLSASAVAAAATIHLVQPRAILLVAPQTPAPSALPQPAAIPQTPTAPQAVPQIVSNEDANAVPKPAPAAEPLPVQPLPAAQPATMALPASPAVAMMAQSAPIAAQDAENDTDIDNDGPGGNYTICAPSNSGNTECSLNGYTHKGPAILFERDGKTYVIDDPVLVKQAHEAWAPVGVLGKQQGELGRRQGFLGGQQGQLGDLAGRLGALEAQMSAMQIHVDMPKVDIQLPKDFDSTVNALADSSVRLALDDKLSDAERAQLQSQQQTAQQQLDKIRAEWKMQEPQREAMEKQIREQTEQIRKQMEPLMQQMRELDRRQADMGRAQGELGRLQAQLGRQQREATRDAESKMQSLIDQAMKDGKARPAQ